MSDQPGPDHPVDTRDEAPLNVVFEADLTGGGLAGVRTWRLPDDATRETKDAAGGGVGDEDDGPRERPDKVHPALRRWTATLPIDERHQLIVMFAEHLDIPRFPEPASREPRTSPRNVEVQARADELVRRIRADRERRYLDLERTLRGLHPGIEIRARYWLTSGVLIEAPLAAVGPIAAADVVVSVEPRYPGEVPPGTIVDGRNAINSDPYFDLGLNDTWIALLDTGVLATHPLLSNLGDRRDCVNGGADCNTGVLHPGDDWNHGTPSAAILAANIAKGNKFRGVTAAQVNSFKIYTPKTIDVDAAKRGFEAAVKLGNKVVVAEIQGFGSDFSGIAADADNAFGTGAVVIAANGNYGVVGTTGTVNCPANAHCAIGVGAYSLPSGVQYSDQSMGPTRDGRVKPDVQGPTDTETASIHVFQGNGGTAAFGATSGATPYVAGAAALLRSWLSGAGLPVDPGIVYALLILFAQNNGQFDNTTGAGRLQLRFDGKLTIGVAKVLPDTTTDIAIAVDGGIQTAAAAIWWPEKPADPEQHNRVTLAIVDPAGNVQADSSHGDSVFQRCSVDGGLAAGSWQVRIRGAAVVAPDQQVYWAVHRQG